MCANRVMTSIVQSAYSYHRRKSWSPQTINYSKLYWFCTAEAITCTCSRPKRRFYNCVFAWLWAGAAALRLVVDTTSATHFSILSKCLFHNETCLLSPSESHWSMQPTCAKFHMHKKRAGLKRSWLTQRGPFLPAFLSSTELSASDGRAAVKLRTHDSQFSIKYYRHLYSTFGSVLQSR